MARGSISNQAVRMQETVRIADFESRYQAEVARLINTSLGARFGFVDESMNPDLYDIGSSYRDGEFLLALDGEQVVATGALVPVDAETAQIARMHTASDHRRRGIATRILAALEQRATARGVRRLILETNLDWADAIAFYQRRGYTETFRNDLGIRFRKALVAHRH